MMRLHRGGLAWILTTAAVITAIVLGMSVAIHLLTSARFRDLGVPVSAVSSIVLAIMALGAIAAGIGGTFACVVGLLRVVRWGVGVPAPRSRPSHP
jgi:hypothetical protein